MKKQKSMVAILLAVVMCAVMLGACSATPTPTANAATVAPQATTEATAAATGTATKSDATLELEITWTDKQLTAFKGILDKYTAETGTKFNILSPGQEYETQMKIRMASNSMPDLFNTHGWSVIRYSEYLRALNDQSWYSDIDSSALGVISDAEGKIYVLPVSVALSCICYNKDVLKEAGVDWTTIKTWADFEAACEKVKAIGKTPVVMGAKESGNAGGLINSISLGYFAPPDSPRHDQIQNLLNGSFDWAANMMPVYEKIVSWRDKGYFNKDFMTLDTVGMQQSLGAGNCAFLLRTSTYIGAALTYSPNANLGLMAYPAVEQGGKLSCAVGEGTTFGVSKSSKNTDAALAFLSWLAKPENAAMIIAFDGCTAGLKDTPDNSVIKKAYTELLDAYGADNIYFDNMFDRKYLPNGAWNVISEGTAQLLDGTAPADVASYMQENYNSLYAAAQKK